MSEDYDPEAVTQTERETWDRFGKKYLYTFAVITGRGAPFLIEAADIRPGDRVLELGCGPGNVAARLAETGARVVGVDLAPQMIRAARATYRDIDFREANAEDLPFESNEFQVVAARCAGDANGDGVVDPLDSGFVLARFGCPVNTGDPNCDIADMNGDGLVDPLDVGFILSRFGVCE